MIIEGKDLFSAHNSCRRASQIANVEIQTNFPQSRLKLGYERNAARDCMTQARHVPMTQARYSRAVP
jgi:hypothetical protein